MIFCGFAVAGGRRDGVRMGTDDNGEVRRGTEFTLEEFLTMPGHIRPPRLNIDKNTKTGELFQIFKEYILDADITTPEGYKLKAKEGHFYSFCCGKKNGRKGHIAKAENSAQALRMVKNSEISQDDIE